MLLLKYGARIKRTHVTREEALACLKVTSDEFDRLCLLNDIRPKRAPRYEMTNKSTPVQYRLEDIYRMRDGEVSEKLALKEENRRKKEAYLRQSQENRIKELKSDKIDYGQLILERYPAFSDVLGNLGECISCLFVTERLIRHAKKLHIRFETDFLCKIRRQLELFLLWSALHVHSAKTFISPHGVACEVVVKDTPVFWREPFDLKDPEDILGINTNIIVATAELYAYLLEKVNYRLFKEESLEWYIKQKKSSEAENDKEAAATGGPIDLCGLYREFMELTKDQAHRVEGAKLFSGCAFFISDSCRTMRDSVTFFVLLGGGELCDDPRGRSRSRDSFFYVTDGEVEKHFEVAISYVHPQFIYDSLNSGKVQDATLYRAGKSLPLHTSPFSAAVDMENRPELSRIKRERIEEAAAHYY